MKLSKRMKRTIRAWAQLVRIPNTFTAAADIVAGFCILVGTGAWTWSFAIPLLLLCLASISFYWAGMILNDVHDIETDRDHNRPGPLVDERIGLETAQNAGWGLIATGVLLAIIAGWLVPQSLMAALPPFAATLHWVPAAVAVLLSATIVTYDITLKETAAAPVVMGLCRGLNMLLGMSLGWLIIDHRTAPRTVAALAILGYILYITGITVAARRESSKTPDPKRSKLGWGLCVVGLIFIAFCSTAEPGRSLRLNPLRDFPVLIGVLMIPWGRRVYESLRARTKESLGSAIRQSIFSILFLDAALTTQFSGVVPGLVVCSLVIPTYLLTRSFRST